MITKNDKQYMTVDEVCEAINTNLDIKVGKHIKTADIYTLIKLDIVEFEQIGRSYFVSVESFNWLIEKLKGEA